MGRGAEEERKGGECERAKVKLEKEKDTKQEKNSTTAGQCHAAHGRQASVGKREICEFWTDRTNEQMNH